MVRILKKTIYHQIEIDFKDGVICIISYSMLKRLISFSKERKDHFTDFLKEVLCTRAFCFWSNKLFQSLDPHAETENLVWLYTNWFSTKLFLLYLVGYWCWIFLNWVWEILGPAFALILNINFRAWLILRLYIVKTFILNRIFLISVYSLFAILNASCYLPSF